MSDDVTPVRLVWKKGEKGKSVSIPAGRYRIRNYNILKHKDGEVWTLSGSGPRGKTVTVRKGEATRIEIDDRIKLMSSAKRMRGKINVTSCFLGDSRMGLTLMRGEKRVPFEATIHAGERQVGRSTLRYG